MLETQIQKKICDELAKRGHFFWRVNNVPTFDPVRKVHRKMGKYAMKGVSDIIVLHKGRVIFLEVKRPKTALNAKTYLSKDQKEFEKNVNLHAGEYYVVRCNEDLDDCGL